MQIIEEGLIILVKTGGNVVIIGGGISGMAAAIQAKQKGAGQVVILEQGERIGGSAFYAPVPDLTPKTSDEMYYELMEYSNWTCDARIVRTLTDKITEIPAWLSTISVGMRGGELGGLAATLTSECERLGAQILTGAKALKLIKDGDGWMCAVEYEHGGKVESIDATVVIMATGSFLSNSGLMSRFCPYYNNDFLSEVNAPKGANDGIGTDLALEAGAGDEGVASIIWSHIRLPFYSGDIPESVKIAAKAPEALWVNNVGVRFSNEANPHSPSVFFRQPNRDIFIVLSDSIINALEEKFPGKISVEVLKRDIQPLIEADQALITDDIGALAAWIRGKKHILGHGIDRYNECCDEKRDFLFGKDSDFLVALSGGPYYVLRSGLTVISTQGPVKVNPMMSCVTATDFPVSGLLACGALVGGLYSNHTVLADKAYSVQIALASGMVAGAHAAAFIGGGGPAPKYEFPKFSAKQVMAGDFYNVGTVQMPPDMK